MDPLTEQYHEWGAYVFSGNRVVDSFELEGLEPVHNDEIVQGDRVIDEYGWEWVSNGTEWTIALDQTTIIGNARGMQPIGIQMASTTMDSELLPISGWTDNTIFNEGIYYTNGIFYSQLNGNTTSTNSTSFDFTAVDYNGGLNYQDINANLNIKAINVQGGLSAPYLIGEDDRLQAYLAGTVIEGTIDMNVENKYLKGNNSLTGRLATGKAGLNLQSNENGLFADAGLYGAILELEGGSSISLFKERFQIRYSRTIAVGAAGYEGKIIFVPNNKNNTIKLGLGGKAADVFGIGVDFELVIPNPF